jgi:hypothetical protein
MAREFTKNMFIMLLSIMVGAVIITYFVGDVVYQSSLKSLTTQHTVELETIEEMNINFTDHFLKSSALLDSAREDRALGNYYFDLAFLWYQSALSETNNSTMDLYKNRTIDNCTSAIPQYQYSHDNFETAKSYFSTTKNYTTYVKYWEILDLYIGLTGSGSNLAMLRHNASGYLRLLAENLTFVNGSAGYLDNMSELMDLFNETMGMYGEELEIYEGYEEEIDEYQFFDEIR